MLCLVLLALLLHVGHAHARRVAGVEIPETLEIRETVLVLNGSGVRTMYFVDVYVTGLYLKKRSRDAAAIVAADEVMAIRIRVISGLVTGGRMQKSSRQGFERSTGGNTGPIRKQIEALIGVYDEGVSGDDVFDIVYVPGLGMEAYKNGVHARTVRSDLSFKRAFFGIWLAKLPAQQSLKRELLGDE